MFLHVLGSAAGGGFPQWNCHCAQCSGLRNGTLKGTARTQSSLAVSADGTQWVLLNASPDLRSQLTQLNTPPPLGEIRHTPVTSIVLVDAQLDHTAGLALLREGDPLKIYCTQQVERDLSKDLPYLDVLKNFCGVSVHQIGAEINVAPQKFSPIGGEFIDFTPIPLSGKAPRYSRFRSESSTHGHVIALFMHDTKTGGKALYAPALDQFSPLLLNYLEQADVLLIDGTFWTENELIQLGASQKKASDMGHWALSGSQGLIAALQKYSNKRIILTHINNTNPILDERSDAFHLVRESGIEVAYDGMRIEL